ncbi:MAG: IS200/IS605 family transposase [Chloroflexi bacterium]|nr:IS200/IS605 family transposase [Chloroflexota bacterium]
MVMTMKRAGAFYQLVFHFVWGTRNRLPLLTPAVEDCLYPYIAAKCKELGYVLHAVNGAADHVHLLVELSPTILVADVAKNLKGASSHHINKESGLADTLYWQDGYGVLTMRCAEIPQVVRYIQTQKAHHQTGNLSTLLERCTL